MSTACKCTNPDGGGTKCPSQHIAVCIRERDGHCYGECVPIPDRYDHITFDFSQWLTRELNRAIREFIDKWTTLNVALFTDQYINTDAIRDYIGQLTFEIGYTRIYVRFRFEFATL